MYAVIDLETTGLRTSWHDRIIEVAVVHVDESGRITDDWCSLVNPDRDLGPQMVHGISAAEARRAPSFTQLAGHIAGLLGNRVLVVHNLPFDAMFLDAEYRRVGIELPIDAGEGLCTMRWAAHFLPQAGRSLQSCCRAAGLPKHHAHSALHDARATAHLLSYYLAAAGSPPPWTAAITAAGNRRWPAIAVRHVTPVHRRSRGQREEPFLTRLVDRLPRLHQPKGDAYLALLDRALLDRHISASEAGGLVATAEAFGLARDDVLHLHRVYLDGLAVAALDDGILTAAERHDLHQVAGLLGLPTADVDQALAVAEKESRSGGRRPDSWQLRSGDVVVFTGAMEPPREEWQSDAVAAGLRVADNVTTRTKLLIAADPDTMSGKAKKARQYGIPIVHTSAYLNMLATLPVPTQAGRP